MGNIYGVGPREQVIINILADQLRHTTTEIMMESAEVEVATRGASMNDARAYLKCEGSTYYCFWRVDTHVVIQRLIERGLIERTERGFYKITEEGMKHDGRTKSAVNS